MVCELYLNFQNRKKITITIRVKKKKKKVGNECKLNNTNNKNPMSEKAQHLQEPKRKPEWSKERMRASMMHA